MATKKLVQLINGNPSSLNADTDASNSTVAMRGSDGSLAMTAGNMTGLVNTGYTYTGVSSQSSSFTVNDASNTGTVYLCDASGGAITVTLPAAASSTGKRLVVKRTSASNNVVLDANSSETIDGATTKTITTQYGFLDIVCDGAGWHIIASGGTIT